MSTIITKIDFLEAFEMIVYMAKGASLREEFYQKAAPIPCLCLQ